MKTQNIVDSKVGPGKHNPIIQDVITASSFRAQHSERNYIGDEDGEWYGNIAKVPNGTVEVHYE